MRAVRILTFGVLVATLGVVASPPAGAAVSVVVFGNQISVTVTGDETVSFSCASGNVRVNATTVSPAIACSALTYVGVQGDGGAQTINGADLDAAVFAAGPNMNINVGGGADIVTDTLATTRSGWGQARTG